MEKKVDREIVENEVLGFLKRCAQINHCWEVEDFSESALTDEELSMLADMILAAYIDSDGQKISLSVINWFSHMQALTGLMFSDVQLSPSHRSLKVDIPASLQDGIGARILFHALDECKMTVGIDLPTGFEFTEQNWGSAPCIDIVSVRIIGEYSDERLTDMHTRLRTRLEPIEKALTISALSNSYRNLHAYAEIDERYFFLKSLPSPGTNTFDQFFE
jgi:hypothetical protein